MSEENQKPMRVSKKKVLEAKLYCALNKRLVSVSLKTIMYFLALLSLLFLLFHFFGLINTSLGKSVVSGSFSLMAFIAINFVDGYLRGLSQKQKIQTEGVDVNKALSFDALRCADELTKENPDLARFVQAATQTPRSIFARQEIGLTNETLSRVISSHSEQENTQNLLLTMLEEAFAVAVKQSNKNITSTDFFYGTLKTSSDYQRICLEMELDDNDIQNIVFWTNRYFENIEKKPTLIEVLKTNAAGLGQDWSSGYTLALDRFGTDLTKKGISKSYSIEGRWDTVRQIEKNLVNDAIKSCLLVGPTGVGKTTLGYGLASKLFWGLSESSINYHRVIKLDAQRITSISSDRASIQNVLTAILNDAIRAGNVILFIDEIQNLFSEDKSLGSINVTEIIQPYLENSNIRIVGTITEADYEAYIRPKTIIAGNFGVVKIQPTDETQTMRILCDMAIYVTRKHKKLITYGALKKIYQISESTSEGKEMPAKAIDLLLEIGSAGEIASRSIRKEDVLNYIQKNKGLPVADLGEESKEKILNLDKKIKTRLVGQEEAVAAVVSSLKRALTQERKNTKPIGSFLFLGPTGVGKTELAKSLAWSYFGDEKTMVRMDMSQYKEVGSIVDFTGKTATGKKELERGGFVKKIRQNPYSVVLLDEIEKANREVLDLFLQILDEGYLVDGAGQKVSLTNNIIIATSNAGALEIKEAISQNNLDFKDQVLNKIQQDGTFKPEFLNRFDGIILFSPLKEKEILQIAGMMTKRVVDSYFERGYKISVSDELVVKLAEEGYQPELGARPMQRVIQEKLENYIADRVLDNTFQKGNEYKVGTQDVFGGQP